MMSDDVNFQGVADRYAKLTKGYLKYHGHIDLNQYYIVSQEIIDSPTAKQDTKETWEVQVCLIKLIPYCKFCCLINASFRCGLPSDAVS